MQSINDVFKSTGGSSPIPLSWNIHICSENNFPTAAGLASSAAGYVLYRARENRKHRKRRLQKMEVKSGSRRKFWEGATKKIIVIFVLFYYFKIGPLAFQSGTNSRRTTFSGGVGVHILKFIWQKILPEKNPACRQFEVFSSPGCKDQILIRSSVKFTQTPNSILQR